jgi:DNA (cytosine-5)-methyltransferase 1
MDHNMKYLSLFSGIEAATVAWKQLGWECIGVSEIDPFACEVLKYHYPKIPNLGDITKITKETLHDIKQKYTNEPLIVVGGSPCQAFSISGLRKGLEDPRGNLMLEYIRVVATIQPTYFIWENVPGVLSSNNGKDFGTLLQTMAQLGYSLCWRTLDSKNFGVPQRRRRVFLVGHLGNEKRPFEILFEPKSMHRNNPKSKQKRQDNTPNTTQSTTKYSGPIIVQNGQTKGITKIQNNISPTLTSHIANSPTNSPLIATIESTQPNAIMNTKTKHSPTLTAAMGDGGGHIPMTIYHTNHKSRPPKETNLCPTLTAAMGDGGGHIPMTIIPFKHYRYTNIPKHSGCLLADDGRYKLDHQWVTSNKIITEKQYASTLCARDHKGIATDSWGHDSQQAVVHNTRVRRLTPIECERLQGFPDNYTQIPWKGKEAKDCPTSHRYRCLGNSMTTNVMLWIGKRIDGIHTHSPTKKKQKKTT